jgi:hypothetical protein
MSDLSYWREPVIGFNVYFSLFAGERNFLSSANRLKFSFAYYMLSHVA